MPKLTISDLDKELRGKNLRPIYFIYGPESYLAATALARIKEAVAKVNGEDAEPDRFSGKANKPGDILASAETMPMFAKMRLIIVSEAHAIKDAESFVKYFMCLGTHK